MAIMNKCKNLQSATKQPYDVRAEVGGRVEFPPKCPDYASPPSLSVERAIWSLVVRRLGACVTFRFTWVQGLGGGFDVPHAASVPSSTEGSGVGQPSEPPVATTRTKPVLGAEVVSAAQSGCVRLSFEFQVAEQTSVVWETVVVGRRLYLWLVHLPEGSKEAFVSLLEYAEEVLGTTSRMVVSGQGCALLLVTCNPVQPAAWWCLVRAVPCYW
ncbi:hypothetical protein GWK47_048347 [Chionoecetes opilio]|uniref:Ornithine decarboxylase antizyme n=1 Tax=Chionoecetes opilio TaxID=41210 RepID=A0A8J4Y4E5_CHIOP|nr:hypothetical protein GWK47_048347 [Chionoecetes opilio]